MFLNAIYRYLFVHICSYIDIVFDIYWFLNAIIFIYLFILSRLGLGKRTEVVKVRIVAGEGIKLIIIIILMQW